ncbi:MAG: hypothetical protein KKE23_00660 [Nanoarchaeota archaeon]|nr:hypothetical protein [Nanoarchaeota archaeon]
MAYVSADFELKKRSDKYLGQIHILNYTVRYSIDDEEFPVKIKITGDKFYKKIPKEHHVRISQSLLSGIVQCFKSFKQDETLRDELGMTFMNPDGNKAPKDWNYYDYELLIKIPKRVKKSLRKEHIKNLEEKF